MSGQAGQDALNNRAIVPSSPFEIQATQELLQQRIENGELTQADVDLVKQGYKWMSVSATVGTLTCGLGTLYALRMRRPPINLGLRLLGAGSMGMVGSFIGFTIGGAAATMEVERNMPDAQRKMQVFAEIAQDTRQKIVEHRAHQIEQRTGKSPFPNGLPPSRSQRAATASGQSEPTWDPESQEKVKELEREREMSGDLGKINEDSGFASAQSQSARSDSKGGREGIVGATKGTWDKIREKTFAKTDHTAGAGATGMGVGKNGGNGGRRVEDERSREQREFDEMLEKERQGVAIEDKWA